MNLNPLNPVWKTYQVSIECLDIANEIIKQQKANWFTHSQWLNQPEAKQDIVQAKQEIVSLK